MEDLFDHEPGGQNTPTLSLRPRPELQVFDIRVVDLSGHFLARAVRGLSEARGDHVLGQRAGDARRRGDI